MAAVGPLRTLLRGVLLVPGWGALTQKSCTPAVSQCLRLHPGWCRSLRVSPASSLSTFRTEPQRSPPPNGTAGPRKDGRTAVEQEDEEGVREGPEYIPRKRRTKNPLRKIGYAWMVGLPAGIISFILAKRQVDKNRLKQLKVRQRMRLSTEGEYEGNRYHRPAEEKLDR